MFYVSSKKEPYYYRIQRIKKGNTSKGEPYTFIEITHKDKRDGDKWKNASLTIWEDVRANEGDKIAIYSVSGFNYSERESGFKKFISVEAVVNRFDIKKAEDGDSKPQGGSAQQKPPQTPAPAPAQTNTAPVQQNTSKSALIEDDDGGDWSDIPF